MHLIGAGTAGPDCVRDPATERRVILRRAGEAIEVAPALPPPGRAELSLTSACWRNGRVAETEIPATEDEMQEERPVLNTTEARQGVTGHNVRYVLLFGLVAVVIVFVVGYFAAGSL
jgi:hypothetical protein